MEVHKPSVQHTHLVNICGHRSHTKSSRCRCPRSCIRCTALATAAAGCCCCCCCLSVCRWCGRYVVPVHEHLHTCTTHLGGVGITNPAWGGGGGVAAGTRTAVVWWVWLQMCTHLCSGMLQLLMCPALVERWRCKYQCCMCAAHLGGVGITNPASGGGVGARRGKGERTVGKQWCDGCSSRCTITGVVSAAASSGLVLCKSQ